jgi:hypothetical protein
VRAWAVTRAVQYTCTCACVRLVARVRVRACAVRACVRVCVRGACVRACVRAWAVTRAVQYTCTCVYVRAGAPVQAAVEKAELWAENEQSAPCHRWDRDVLNEINSLMPWEQPRESARRPWLAGMRLRARIADYYHAETNTFKYHLRNWLQKCGFEVVLDSAAATQTGVSCGVVASAVQAQMLNAGADWFTSPNAATMAGAVSRRHIDWAYNDRRNWEEAHRSRDPFGNDHTRFVSNFEIEKMLPRLCSHLYGADQAAQWRLGEDFKVTVGQPHTVVMWIARFLHAAREAIHNSGAFSGTRRFISNTECGRGIHWIAVVVSVETVNPP